MQQGVKQRVDAGDRCKWVTTEFLDKTRHIPGICYQDVTAAQVKKGKAISRQCKDVIKRQGCDDGLL